MKNNINRTIADVMGGNIFSKDSFVNFFPFLIYLVALSMLYITNIYIAEDTSREISKMNAKAEDLYVEYVYLRSEITETTKQSNLAKMLKNKGIKESLEPMKKITVEKGGGAYED